MPTELHLIRHGQSHANVEPVVGGMLGDVGLTDLGHEQARRLADRLADEGFRADQLYASTLPRAQQTAETLAAVLHLPVRSTDTLQELRTGEADGLSTSEWRERWPGFGSRLAEGPYHPFATGGESWAQLLVRTGAALQALVDAHPDEAVVAVTHGGVIEAAFSHVFGLGPTAPEVRYGTRNSSRTHWRHDADPDRATWTLVTFNDCRHLDD